MESTDGALPSQGEIAACIGLLAVLASEHQVGELPPHLARRLQDRLNKSGIVPPGEVTSLALGLESLISSLRTRIRRD